MNTIVNELEKHFGKELYSCIEYKGKVYFSLKDDEELKNTSTIRVLDLGTNTYSTVWIIGEFDLISEVWTNGTELV